MSLAQISDDALPGLRIVADQKLFLAALTRALAEADRNHGPLASMRIVRVRYRKGERAVIHAEFDGQAADEQALHASIWLRSRESAARRGRKAAAGQAKGAPVYEPLSGALVHFFPSDPYVPEIAQFVSDPQRHSAALLGDPAAPAGIPELARFRPGIGATFRWGAQGTPGAYVKIQKECDARIAIELLRDMGAASAGRSFSVPQPKGLSEDINAFAMEEVLGDTLDQRLAKASPSVARAAVSSVLRGLKDFHECALVPHLRKDRTHLISRAQSAARRVGEIEPGVADRAAALADRIAGYEIQLAEKPAHCDIKLEHIVFCGQQVTFLDLDSFALSDPLFDLAMLDLRAMVAARTGAIGKAASTAVSDSVREAARLHYGPNAAPRLAWLKACASMQVARHFAQNPGPNSTRLCRLALKTGEKSLGALMLAATIAIPLPAAMPNVPPAPPSETIPCV
ncbi:MAG: phosphotransferase [Rhizobiaceae bacterium]